jgi:hypothetical protein
MCLSKYISCAIGEIAAPKLVDRGASAAIPEPDVAVASSSSALAPSRMKQPSLDLNDKNVALESGSGMLI